MGPLLHAEVFRNIRYLPICTIHGLRIVSSLVIIERQVENAVQQCTKHYSSN